MTDECGLLVNSSRGIIYASNGEAFAEAAAREAEKLAAQMKAILNQD
jgi:orotidine-5'-phosphate decarboxylase